MRITALEHEGFALWQPEIPLGLMADVNVLCRDAVPENGHMPFYVRMSEPVMAIARRLAARPELNAILGGTKTFLHMPPMVRRVDPGADDAAVPRHQDRAYNLHINGRFVTVWLPLVPIDSSCGGMAIYPGTTGREHPRASDGPVWLGACRLPTGTPRIVLDRLPAGMAVVLADDVVHESIPNTSERPRMSIDYRFFNEEATSIKPSLELPRQ